MTSENAPIAVYLSLGFFALALVVVGRRVPGYWRAPDARLSTMPVYWLWGEATWRGFVRAIPTILIDVALVIALGVYMLIVGPARVRADLFWIWFALFVLSLLAWGTIVIFNQPKFLVPPYLRAEQGVWRRRRRA